MKTFFDKEFECTETFNELGDCFHLWTSENFEIIFTSEDDFKAGMGIIAICAKLFPDVIILTFSLMTNHLHITFSGSENRGLEMFARMKAMFRSFFKGRNRTINWAEFKAGIRKLNDLQDVRNVIVYNNRNGYVVNSNHTPFSYPWGANMYYFNQEARKYALQSSKIMGGRKKRKIAHSHCADGINSILTLDGYALPLSFCAIEKGESLFRDATHYFFKVSRNNENSKLLAKEIGETLFYNDEELFASISKLAKERFQAPSPSTASIQAKVELAKVMHFEYNASPKQIIRILKVPQSMIKSMGFNK